MSDSRGSAGDSGSGCCGSAGRSCCGSGGGAGISGCAGGVDGISGCGDGSTGISGCGSRSVDASHGCDSGNDCESSGASGSNGCCEAGCCCGLNGGAADCGRKMFGPSGTSRCDCSAMRCFKPAIQRRLRSSSDRPVVFSTFRSVELRGGVCGRVVVLVPAVRVGLLLSTSITSVAPLRCAQSIALRPRLSRNCGSAPASSRRGMRCV